ncbi:tectonin beta-propeller repeat-containing protein-like [Macrosteles quadrilineatus]|uniref:tectonin beta-propeller repeat-containing protein-like n=1 Tax=Macrosteles quadrilineatus TaxID=74068 RepID=UPI0023E187DD|nr:tectonin beta-propeller repeat-containing protein-like [Macrosteles quadrilineatus]
MPSSMLFAVNNDGKIFGLSTNGTKWREFQYLGLDFKQVSAVPNFLWAVGSDRQIYVHVHGLDIPIRIKEESYENQRWSPIQGFGKHMLPTDRYRWSTKDGLTERRLDKIRLPSMAWQWEGDWHIETTLDGQQLDDDGWTYAVDFPATYHSTKQWSSCVRRRKWVRYRRYAAINSWCAIAPLHKDPTQEPFIDVSIGGIVLPGCSTGSMQVWAVTAYGRVMYRSGVSRLSPEGVRWTSVSLPAGCDIVSLSCGATGLVWAVMFNGRALVRGGITGISPTGSHWVEVAAPEEGLRLVRVSVGTNSVWAVTSDQRVWFHQVDTDSMFVDRVTLGGGGCSRGRTEASQGSHWVEVAAPEEGLRLVRVSVGTNSVWAVTSDQRVWFHQVDTDSMFVDRVTLGGGGCSRGRTEASQGSHWVEVAAPEEGLRLVRVSVGTNSVWAVTRSHWVEVAAPEEGLRLVRVSVGTNSVWAVTSDQRVWFRKGVKGSTAEGGTSDELVRGSGWVEMVGEMAMVSVATNDQVFGVGAEDRTVYYRAGVSAAELTGRRWRPLHAITQYSRSSSLASSQWSVNGKQHSASSLNRNSLLEQVGEGEGEGEQSRSAPVSTKQAWRRSVDGSNLRHHHRQSSDSGAVEHPVLECSQSEVDLSRRSVRAWSPVRSVGSVLGMEAMPSTDPSLVLDPECERDVFRERDGDIGEPSWDQAATMWVCVEAGAVTVDPAVLPNWFHEGVLSGQFESAPWRTKILADLRQRLRAEVSSFEKYELAVEMASWVKSGECRCCLPGTVTYDDCVVELEWIGSQAGSLEAGTLSILTVDKAHTRTQLSLGEVVCVANCSEPGCSRVAVHTLRSAATQTTLLKLHFSGDEQEKVVTGGGGYVANCSEPGCSCVAVHTLHSAATQTTLLKLHFSGDEQGLC